MASALFSSPPSPSSSPCVSRRNKESALVCRSGCSWRSITMRDRSKNRKPLQKGRNLSCEAIQAIQALKRARRLGDVEERVGRAAPLDIVMESKVRRLLKFDMMAVLGELQRQNESFLALQIFEEMRKEYWYKPKLSVYVDLITVLGRNGALEEVDRVCSYIMKERWEPDTEGFNSLFQILLHFGRIRIAMDCYRLMKLWESEPDEETFRILISGLESMGEMDLAAGVRQEAEKHFGCLDFLSDLLPSHQ